MLIYIEIMQYLLIKKLNYYVNQGKVDFVFISSILLLITDFINVISFSGIAFSNHNINSCSVNCEKALYAFIFGLDKDTLELYIALFSSSSIPS